MKQALPTIRERALKVMEMAKPGKDGRARRGLAPSPVAGLACLDPLCMDQAGNGPDCKVCGIILAAGFSTRMQGQFKPLLRLPMPSPDLDPGLATGTMTGRDDLPDHDLAHVPAPKLCPGLNTGQGAGQVAGPGTDIDTGLDSGRSFRRIEEITALEAVIRCQQAAGIQPIVVCGYRHEDCAAIARRCGAMVANNPRPEEGMFSSLLAGLSALPPVCSHFLVQPVDIPLVRQLTFRILLDMAQNGAASGNKPQVIIPTWQGKPGHPPLIPASFVATIQAFHGNGGLAAILDSLPCQKVAVPDKYILEDMDTPEAYMDMRQAVAGSDALAPDEVQELLYLRGLPEQTIAHCQAVGMLAEAMSRALNRMVNTGLDPELAHAGGLAHDLCKGSRRHEEAAGRFFRQHGLGLMAWLVESHRDLAMPADQPIRERELVYLADKLVSGKRPVTVEERFGEKMEKFASEPAIHAEISGRMERAKNLALRFAKESGQDPLELAKKTLAQNAWPENVLPQK